jgi:hypothetical protein
VEPTLENVLVLAFIVSLSRSRAVGRGRAARRKDERSTFDCGKGRLCASQRSANGDECFGRLQEILGKSADDQARARRRSTIRSVLAQDFEPLLT